MRASERVVGGALGPARCGLAVVLLSAVVVAGCRREEPPRTAEEAAARAAERAAEAAVEEEAAAAAPYVVTAEKLDGFVRYQRRMLEGSARLTAELEAMARGVLPDGGPLTGAAARAGLEGKARLEEEARREAGLTPRDVRELSAVVTAVMAQRHLGDALDYGEELERLEAVRAKLPPEQARTLDPQVEALRARDEEFRRLPALRRAHGDANVDAVLAREADLRRNYEALLGLHGGGRPRARDAGPR